MIALPFDRCVQINLQPSLGGGEIYTAAVGRAMAAIGLPTDIIVNQAAAFWPRLVCGGARLLPIARLSDLPKVMPTGERQLVIVHAGVDAAAMQWLRSQGHKVAAFAHMPYHERSPVLIQQADVVCAVSGYVLRTLRDKGVVNVFPAPFFGVADLQRNVGSTVEIHRGNEFDWDKRKFRDRVLSWMHPFWSTLRPQRAYARKAGITLGLVSRITTIKQFPELFRCLSPVLRDYPQIHVAVFGQGGYKSVRDLKHALAPLGDRVSFWGHQRDVLAVYRSIDWLLSGLPEKEALGLNIIEAQTAGVPVLAVDAPPFSETVMDGVTGLCYADPRQDGAASFRVAIERIVSGDFHRDEAGAAQHLAQFSEAAFADRFRALITSF